MQPTEFLRMLSADDINAAFAILMREERDAAIDLRAILAREAHDYPVIAELLGSLGDEVEANGGVNTRVLNRLHGMLIMARALVMLAERRNVH